MKKRIYKLDLSTLIFGRWTVKNRAFKNDSGVIYWNCICSCGTEKAVKAGSLTSGKSISCGCAWDDWLREKNTTHGMTKTRTFKSWDSMKQRCNNPNAPDFERYGGRGIKICDKWQHDFKAFFSDMGERPEATSLDRIDNSGDYTPSNCRWASSLEQQRNTRSSIRLTFKGETLPLIEWSRKTGLNYQMLLNRRKAKWPVEKLLTKPSQKS